MFHELTEPKGNFGSDMFFQPFCYGKVLQNHDKDHPNQIKVQLTALYENGKNEVWANLAVPYGGDSYGICFLPEVSEYVLLAMVSGESPVVISSVFGKQAEPELCSNNNENEKKVIRTKGGNVIFIDDKENKAVIRVQTAKGYIIELSEDSETITIADADKKNDIKLNASDGSVKINAEKKISLCVGGKEALKIEKNKAAIKSETVSIQGTQKIEEKGGQLQISGTSAEIKANASFTVKSSGIAKISGSILKLNG